MEMCEFKVFLDENMVFRDAVYAKIESNNVIVRDVLGELNSRTVKLLKST